MEVDEEELQAAIALSLEAHSPSSHSSSSSASSSTSLSSSTPPSPPPNAVLSPPLPATASISAPPAEDKPPPLIFVTKFEGKTLELPPLEVYLSVGDLKQLLQDETSVPVERQKLIGLVKGQLPADEVLLQDLALKKGPPFAFTLMGTRDEKLFVDPADREDLPEVFDDFDLDYAAISEQWHRSKRNAEKLEKFTAKTEINWINERRPGKPLLVLDLDHCLLDFSHARETEVPSEMLKRPGMDVFLSAVYVHYDIVVWSQTSWRWLEVKLTELGMLSNPGYRICFALDKTSMFTIVSNKESKGKGRGEAFKHSVKPLELIWAKCAPFWNATNTLHVDDLSRNFALNPYCGVKCKPYYRKDAALDEDMHLLSVYLCHIATNDPPLGSTAMSSLVLKNSPSSATLSHTGSSVEADIETFPASQPNRDFTKWDHSKWRKFTFALIGRRS